MQTQTQQIIANYFLCKESWKHESLGPIRCNKIYLRARTQKNERTWKAFGYVCPKCHTIYDNTGKPITQTRDFLKLQLGQTIEYLDRKGERSTRFEIAPLKPSCKHKWSSKTIQSEDMVSILWKCSKCHAYLTQELGKIIQPQSLSETQLKTLAIEHDLMI